MTLNELAAEVAHWRRQKGFYTPSSLNTEGERDSMLGKLFLVVTEVAEAGEEVRNYEKDPRARRVAFEEEIADTFIRLADIVGTMRIDIEKAIAEKMLTNWGRPERHGKSTSL